MTESVSDFNVGGAFWDLILDLSQQNSLFGISVWPHFNINPTTLAYVKFMCTTTIFLNYPYPGLLALTRNRKVEDSTPCLNGKGSIPTRSHHNNNFAYVTMQ